MWPEKGEAISRMIDAERCVEQLYGEALNRWAPSLSMAVLPSLIAATSFDPALPPDPDAATSQQSASSWQQQANGVVLPGLVALWSAEAVEALAALGITLPETPLPEHPLIDAAVLALVVKAIGHGNKASVEQAMAHVAADPSLKSARDAFMDDQQQHVDAIPAAMQAKITAALKPIESTSYADQKVAVADVVRPDSPAFAVTARVAGYQAAGVQNTAVIAAALRSEESDDLEKTWIATIDGKTRPTHFAADGQRTPLGSKFTIGTAELDVPGDPSGPPSEVRNCRCRVGVLHKTEALPDEVDRHTERLNGGDSVQANREGAQADEIERRADNGTVRAREDPEGIGITAAASTQEDDMPNDDTDAGTMYRTFTNAVVAFMGKPTSDGRMLASDMATTFRSFPEPLMWSKQNSEGHSDSFTVGVIEDASVDGDKMVASGYMLNTPEADEAAEQIAHGVTGPSVDLAATDWMLTDDKGKELEEDWWDIDDDVDVYQTITAAELIGVTLVSKPAFGDTAISLNPDRESRDVALVASAAEDFRPKVYDHRMFENPKLTGPTLPTMGEDGRVYGHLACFGACHRSVQSECIVAPRSRADYAHFHTSPAVALSNGTRLPVGRLTVGGGHANEALRAGPAMAHYDNAGTCFALVRVGEDEHGIWFSGVAAPWATAEQIEMGLSSPLSGDWRNMGNGLS